MSKKPKCYEAPLRTRLEIVNFLTSDRGYYGDRFASSPLAWDVKAYGADLSAENLIEVYRHSGEYPATAGWLDYPEWRGPALEKYDEVEGRLWEWATEQAREQVTDTESYKTLWRGILLDVEYGFAGRSGGWLLMTRYLGDDLARMDEGEFRGYLEDMNIHDLRNLYELVVQNDHDFRRKAVEREIEFQAAVAWIENACSDIPKPDMTQANLPGMG